jgi:hypothetical protein
MSITLHGFPLSGHSHRVQLALSLMGLPHQVVQVDLKNGAHKSPEFLKLNPFGQVPVLEDDGTTLFDSNAILSTWPTSTTPTAAGCRATPRGRPTCRPGCRWRPGCWPSARPRRA